MKIHVGKAIRIIRQQQGLSQKAAAEKLGVTNIHLCNVEKGNAEPSLSLTRFVTELWGTDPFVLAWVVGGDVNSLPEPIRPAAGRLTKVWREMLSKSLGGDVLDEPTTRQADDD